MSGAEYTSWHHLSKIQVGGRWKTVFQLLFVAYRDHPYNSAPELRTAMQIGTSPWTPRNLFRSKRNEALRKVKMLMKIRPTT